MTIADVTADTQRRMDAAVEKVAEDFGRIRTGRANPQLLEKIIVDYYGAPTPLQQMANFSVPEGRILVVNPFDKSMLNDVEKAIRDADLGLNPSNDGQIIRCVFPELTEDRRKEYIKMAKQAAEEGKIAIRNVRRSARDAISKLEDDGDVGADEAERANKKLEEVTSTHVARIDALLDQKEHDLLEV